MSRRVNAAIAAAIIVVPIIIVVIGIAIYAFEQLVRYAG